MVLFTSSSIPVVAWEISATATPTLNSRYDAATFLRVDGHVLRSLDLLNDQIEDVTYLLHMDRTWADYEVEGVRPRGRPKKSFSGVVKNITGVISYVLWPANFPCHALDLQLMGDHYCDKPSAAGQPTRPTQPFILRGSINKYQY